MPDKDTTQSAAGLRANDDPRHVGAAILGLYAAVKICRAAGLDVHRVLALVEDHVYQTPTIPTTNQGERTK